MTKSLAQIFLSGLLVACSPQPDLIQTALQFQLHKNEGDFESAVKLFSDEPTLSFGPLGTIKGLPAVRGILEYDLALNTHIGLQDCHANGLEVSCRVVESNDWLRAAGIEFITYDENKFVFGADGRIETISATLSAESEQAMGAAISKFHQWATTNRPTAYAELFSEDGAFVYNRDNAVKVLVLLRNWQNE